VGCAVASRSLIRRRTAGLLSVMLADEGTPDPDGAATDHDRLAYRHARYLCLPTGPISAAGRCSAACTWS
jgi:hypothetical protein